MMYLKSIMEIINVFIAYFILIILVTAFMIKPIVKNENIFKRFLLYIVVGNIYIINIVFLLAYLNIFNRTVLIMTLLFTTVVIRYLLDKEDTKKYFINTKDTIKYLLDGEYGKKIFLQKKLLSIRRFFRELFKEKKIEIIIFLLIMCYNIFYYSYNSVKLVSFGAPDEEVHLYWIQSIIRGNIFPSGVYPHGFHNILTAITELFGFKGVTVINNFQAISIILIMTMLYLGLRKIFRSKYAALFGFTIYSLANIYASNSIFRYQFSLPQEYGMIMLMPMAIFLFNYLKDMKTRNLIYFGMCFYMTICIHFYVTIIAIVICVAIGIVYLYRIIKNKLLLKLIICGILSTLLAIAPLTVGIAMGHEMEQSMDWAIRVIQGKEYDEYKENIDDSEENTNIITWDEFSRDAKSDISNYVINDMRIMYILLSVIIFSIIYNIILMMLRNEEEENLYQLSFSVLELLLIFLILCRRLNIPTLMEPKRVAIFFVYFSSIFIAMPLEIIYMTFRKSKIKKIYQGVIIILIPFFVFFILKFGFMKPMLTSFYFQTKGAMLVDIDIMEKYDDFKWTIVAPVNDISVILNNGYHYELSDFIVEQENWNENKVIRIPTKFVFIYIEKKSFIDDRKKGIISKFNINYEDAKKSLEKGLVHNEYYKEYRNILMSKAYYWAMEYKKYFPKEMSVYYEDDEIIIYRIVQNEYGLNNFAINYGANENR